jgi:alpha-methylacyl-CoA racemase
VGPLRGVKIVEVASIGPGPFCATMLVDMGADVVKVDRTDEGGPGGLAISTTGVLSRGRRSIAVDLKEPDGVEVVLRLLERADGLVEGFRPGVAERLGIGPDVCLDRNPRLVYGRMTGWGQSGPQAQVAGHDIDYLAMSGLLHTMGREGERPVPPLNLVCDYGGGGMLLAFGMVCALWEASRSGRGQVVDAAMVDGAAMLGAQIYELFHLGLWEDRRGVNLLDGGAPFYDTYETADGRYVAVGALEPQFYRRLLEGLGLASEDLPPQYDRSRWDELRAHFVRVFRTRTRDEWEQLLGGEDACLAPVLSLAEAPEHRHNRARRTFVEVDGVVQPAPAPRFGRTQPEFPARPPEPGEHTVEILGELDYDDDEVTRLRDSGAVR